jgi:Na+-translocating ferredoxin:NAD+ oxidoreductase RnfC subunit
MKKAIFVFLMAIPAVSLAQSLQDQIAAVNRAQNENKLAEKAAMEAAQSRVEQEHQARLQHEEKMARIKAASDEQKRKQAQAVAATKELERLDDKKRDQSYEDQLRQLELEEKKLALEARKAKVKRVDEYIDRELGRQDAETDVVQSEADATRSVSKGTEELLRSEGKARENEADKLF